MIFVQTSGTLVLLVPAGNKFINLAMLARAFLALPLQELEIDNLSEQIIVPDRTVCAIGDRKDIV